ncbi:MAG: hypothetical protein ACTHMG_00565 [Sphingomonas sp.]
MVKPMSLDSFARLPARTRAVTVDGLSGLIDQVAQGAAPAQQFLRYQWYADALAADRAAARTIVVESDGEPVIALPLVGFDRRIAMIAGPETPFRSFPARLEAGEAAFDTLVRQLAREVSALALGPCPADDRALAGLLAAARARRWSVRQRQVVAGHADGASVLAALDARGAQPTDRSEWLIARTGLAGWLACLGWRQARR